MAKPHPMEAKMPPLTHSIDMAEGSFRVMVTPGQRVLAVICAHQTPLGPLRLVLEVNREAFLPKDIDPRVLMLPQHQTAGLFGSIKKGINRATHSTFNAAAGVVNTVARPAVNLVQSAAGHSVQLLAAATPLLPNNIRKQMDDAARLVMRARLGDVTAQQFMRTINAAAKAGDVAARQVGKSLLGASKFVARSVDAPIILATKNIPILGNVVRTVSPLQRWDRMATLIERGDLGGLKRMVTSDLQQIQGVISLIPGVGTGVSAAIGAGIAVLNGGSPLEFAVRTAYGAIPIPLGIRQVTDTVVDVVLALASDPSNLTELAIHTARQKVPTGIPRQVFDTLVRVVVHKVPVRKMIEMEATQLADKYVSQYADKYRPDNDVIPNVFNSQLRA